MSCTLGQPGVCDFCQHYAFNGDKSGAYTGDGECQHPAHPHPAEPEDGCEDFDCSVCEQAMVVVRPGVHCDPCLVPLVRALYENGFPTVASCCGHGKQPPSINLADGRQVFVADPEWAETIWTAIAEKRDGPELCRERLAGVQAERDEALRQVRELERRAS